MSHPPFQDFGLKHLVMVVSSEVDFSAAEAALADSDLTYTFIRCVCPHTQAPTQPSTRTNTPATHTHTPVQDGRDRRLEGRICARLYWRGCACVCARARVCVCVRACACVCVCVWNSTCIHMHILIRFLLHCYKDVTIMHTNPTTITDEYGA